MFFPTMYQHLSVEKERNKNRVKIETLSIKVAFFIM